MNSKFSFISYKIWEAINAKIDIMALNNYGNLLAMMDSQQKIQIFDLNSKKMLISFDSLLFPNEHINDFKDFSIGSLQFSKNSGSLAVISQDYMKVLLINLSNLDDVKRTLVYTSNEFNLNILLDPHNKYLFLQATKNGINLRYFKNAESNHKIFEFKEENDKNDINPFEMQYLMKFSKKNQKIFCALKKNVLFFVSFTCFKGRKQKLLMIDDVKVFFSYEINNLNNFDSKLLFSQNYDNLMLVGNKKIRAGFHLNYNFDHNEKSLTLSEFEKISQIIPEKNENEELIEVLFYKFHARFQIYEEFLATISISSSKQLICKFYSLKSSSPLLLNMICQDFKYSPYKILNVICWDGSFLHFCQEKEKNYYFTIATELDTPPSWVNFGFKFKYIDSNVEYQECEDEFDRKEKAELTIEKPFAGNLEGIGFTRNFIADLDVYNMIRQESKKKDKNKRLLKSLYKRININI